MENIPRPISRLWLFQAVVFALLSYIPRLSGLECYCYNEPNDGFGICYWEGDRCTGDICYVHKVLQDGVYYSSWNCLIESVHHIDPVCNKGSFNTATEEYICCSDRDNCNENIRIELPIERPQPVSTNAVTSAPGLAVTTIEGSSGSGSGDITLDPSMISTEGPDLLPESTTSRSTPVSSHPTSRQPSTSTTSRTPTTPAVSRPSATTAPTDTSSLECFCSACPTKRSSCGPNSECYVGRDFQPRQDVGDTAAVSVPESYSWGCFNESEAATKCRETDKYSCCSDKDLCNEHLQPPPLKCFCTSGTCPDGQTYVGCGANTTCYVSLPSDSSSTNASPDSLTWGCFDQPEARVKCNDTQRYNCCSNRDFCNKDLDPPTRRNEECTSTIGGCQTEQQLSLPLVASVTVVAALVVLVFLALLFVVLLVQIRKLKRGDPVKTSSTTCSDSSENSVTTESESLPSPTSTSSPHHHYLHITADDPAFGDSLNKCNVSKA